MMSSLAEVPGHTYEIRGLCIVEGTPSIGGRKIDKCVQDIRAQAGDYGANAVIGLTVVRSGENVWVMYGTAVILRPIDR